MVPEFHHGLKDLFENQKCLKTAFIQPSPLPDSISGAPLIYFPFYYILETTVLSGILVTQRTADNYLLKQRLPQKRWGRSIIVPYQQVDQSGPSACLWRHQQTPLEKKEPYRL